VSWFSRVPPEERLPAPGRSLLLRGLSGGLVIIALAAGASATAGLLQVSDLVQSLCPHKRCQHISNEAITPAEAGKPQTILVLGSDRRFDDLKANNKFLRHNAPARSDTVMLLRLDPSQAATSVMSLPRDLKVTIPGHGVDKLNAAYSYGGPTLTLKTIRDFTGLQINHVVNINFKGFQDVVNAIGCVYTDVDRRYYHTNAGVPIGERYAVINVPAGYQKLCGYRALSYVRYRHNDSDIVRAARQQSFLRQAKQQIGTSGLIDNRSKLIDIFGRNTQTDAQLESTSGLLSILKLALFSAGHPVRQIQFPAVNDVETLPGGAQIDYLTASHAAIRRTVEQFLHPAKHAPRPKVPTPPNSTAPRHHLKRPRHTSPGSVPGLIEAQRAGENLVADKVANNHLGFSIYFPRYLTTTSRYDNPGIRTYRIHDRAGHFHHAYRIVVVQNAVLGQYWGVQGMDWVNPPLLKSTHSTLHRHGRRLSIYKDGAHVSTVAWRSGHAVYWVSNTLSDALDNTQMIEIAATLTRKFN